LNSCTWQKIIRTYGKSSEFVIIMTLKSFFEDEKKLVIRTKKDFFMEKKICITLHFDLIFFVSNLI